MARAFRFGVQSFNAESGEDWAAQATRAEALGYSTFHLADHIWALDRRWKKPIIRFRTWQRYRRWPTPLR